MATLDWLKKTTLALRHNPFKEGDAAVQLVWLYTVGIVACGLLLATVPVAFSNDSLSYTEAGSVFAQGGIDILRTPLYSLFCHTLLTLFPSGIGFSAIICCQYLLFLLSLYAFHRIAVWLMPTSPAVRFTVSLAYLLHPGLLLWHGMVLTESPAICGGLFLTWFMLSYWQHPSRKSALAIGLTLLALIALRPSSIYLAPALGVFVACALWKRHHHAVLLLAGCIFATLCTWGYCRAYKQNYGAFMPGYVTVLNQYWILRNTAIMQSADSEDADVRNHLHRYIDEEGSVRSSDDFYDEFFYLIETYGVERVHRLVESSVSRHRVAYFSALVKQAVEVRHHPAFTYYMDAGSMPFLLRLYVKGVFLLFTFPFHFVYLFLAGYAAGLLWWMRRHKRFPLIQCCLWMMVTANVFVSVFAAMGEWHRLIVPSMPLLFLLMAKAVDYLCVSKG